MMSEITGDTLDKLKAQMIAKRLIAGGGVGTDGVDTNDPAGF